MPRPTPGASSTCVRNSSRTIPTWCSACSPSTRRRKYSLANPAEVKRVFVAATKLPDAVVEKQLKERTELTHSRIGAPQRDSILAAGLALQQAGVIKADVDVKAAVENLIDDRWVPVTN